MKELFVSKKKEFITITIIYCLAHILLVCISGRWWDDWTLYYDIPLEDIKEFSLELGRPTLFYITLFLRMFPENGYRVITFVLFYFCMIFTYQFLRYGLNQDEKTCFWITAIYAVVPVNDARIMLIIFPYSLGLFFYMAGLSLFSKKYESNDLNIKNRIICLILFLCSFILNSNLFYFALVLMLIIYKEKSILRLVHYCDFVILPILYFVLKNILFPAYGRYESYNKISVASIIYGVRNIVIADCLSVKNVVNNIYSYMPVYLFCILFSILFMYMLYKKTYMADRDIKKSCYMILWGIFSLSLALFPYLIIRLDTTIEMTGLGGRDAVLVPLGMSILIYELVNLIFNKYLRIPVMIIFIIGGCYYFNIMYLSYQQDYYRQLGFVSELKQNDELSEAKNIVYLNNDDGIINIQSSHVLSANSYIAYGKQDKFYTKRVEYMDNYMNEENEYLLVDFTVDHLQYMNDYDLNYKRLDAIIEYSFDVGLTDTIKMKIYEIFNKKRFVQYINNRSSMNVYYYGTEEYEKILNEKNYVNRF